MTDPNLYTPQELQEIVVEASAQKPHVLTRDEVIDTVVQTGVPRERAEEVVAARQQRWVQRQATKAMLALLALKGIKAVLNGIWTFLQYAWLRIQDLFRILWAFRIVLMVAFGCLVVCPTVALFQFHGNILASEAKVEEVYQRVHRTDDRVMSGEVPEGDRANLTDRAEARLMVAKQAYDLDVKSYSHVLDFPCQHFAAHLFRLPVSFPYAAHHPGWQ